MFTRLGSYSSASRSLFELHDEPGNGVGLCHDGPKTVTHTPQFLELVVDALGDRRPFGAVLFGVALFLNVFGIAPVFDHHDERRNHR